MQPKVLARVAALLYLFTIMGAAFALWVRSGIVIPGDAEATADNIRASETLFRASFVVDLMANLVYLLTALALYVLLRHVNQLVAAAMIILVAISCAVGSLNLLNHYTAITVATSDAFARGMGETGADALALLLTDMFTNGNILNAIWYGPWLVPLAYLVITSGQFPKVLGVLQIAGCIGYFGWLFTTFLAPDAPAGIVSAFQVVAVVGEGLFLLWLALWGIRLPAGTSAPASPRPALR